MTNGTENERRRSAAPGESTPEPAGGPAGTDRTGSAGEERARQKPPAEPTTAQPTTAQPTTAQPTTGEPTTGEPTTGEPTIAEPGDAAGADAGVARLSEADPARAAELLALLDAERARAVRALQPDPRVIYGVWGASWFVGFLALWLALGDTTDLDVPTAPAAVLFGACITGAIAVTIVHITRRTSGVRGESSRVGALYGWAWFLALGTQTVILNAAYRHGLPEELNALLWPVLSGLVVGTLYLAGGALWQEGLQYRLGVWILVASAAGAIAGYPGVYLVMCLAGGGGFLVAAAYYAVRMRRAVP